MGGWASVGGPLYCFALQIFVMMNVLPSPTPIPGTTPPGKEGCFVQCSWLLFSLQALCLMHTGKPKGVAVSPCITWSQAQLILTAVQIRYHSHLRDHRRTEQL